MTGVYNVRNYIEFGLLDPQATTFGHLLQRAGYATGICGKWQLGAGKDLPRHFGFDEAYLWQHTRRPPRYANPGLEHNGVELEFNGGEYGPKLVNDFALDFVTRHRAHPFFLYYPMILTHDPFQPTPDSPEWDPKTKSEQVQRDVKHFAAMTAYMDKMVGRLVAKLDELGLRENTLVVFTSDNGGLSTSEGWPTSNLPLRGGKGWMYEGGIREPLIVRWPGVTRPGSVIATPVSSPDYFPTFLEAAGLRPAPGQVLDGRSLVPVLKGGTAPERALFWHYPHYGNQGGAPAAAVRRGDWKLIEWQEDNRVELFNLAQDLGEKTDLATREPDRAARLRAELHAWQKDVGAKFPIPNPTFDPAKPNGRRADRKQ
jgi:arylsulfatase A